MKKKVLICPLDWGIGHATRCVPVIRLFLEAGYEVLLAADGRPYDFLHLEFPGLQIIRFPGTKIRYSKKGRLALKILFQLPRFFSGINKEHSFLKKLINDYPVDVIVSDNRYGVWDKRIFSILITHQLEPKLPKGVVFFSGIIRNFMKRQFAFYDECWIPDFENHLGLAGTLSHPSKPVINSFYIGHLSRFEGLPSPGEMTGKPVNDILFMISGPEPQRSVFEEIIFSQVRTSGLKAIIVRGITERSDTFDLSESCKVYSHLGTNEMLRCILQSEFIISRPGYSSIMDFITLGKKAIFIPTPGQTEQEYLAKYLMIKKIYFSMEQRSFDLIYALEMSRNYPGMVIHNDFAVLRERINRISNI
jgi:UDP:flavonoid glycosyltransferase YjiC (YdhE family)